MDKLNNALELAKKHHFWVLVGAVVVVGIMTWTFAEAENSKYFKRRKTTLDNHFKNMDGICGYRKIRKNGEKEAVSKQSQHPNERVIRAIEDDTEKLETDVANAWRTLFNIQKANNRLPDGLTPRFKRAFSQLKHDQKYQGENTLPNHLLEEYQSFIGNRFPKLFEQVQVLKSKPKKQESAAGDSAREPYKPDEEKPSEEEEEMEGLVQWDESKRQELIDRFTWRDRPSTLKVVLAQEDLWVYEALLRVIQNTNEGATDRFNAAVKRIDALDIGPDAVAAWEESEQAILKVPAKGAEMGTSTSGTSYTATGSSYGGMALSQGVSEGSAASIEGEELQDGRYVDDKGQPLKADAALPYNQFKMMPIRMALLIECANSSMPIKVRRFRLNSTGGSEALDLTLAAGAERMPSYGGDFRGGRRIQAQKVGEQQRSAIDNSYDVPVEIQGVIYIYNRPPEQGQPQTGTPAAERPGGRPTGSPPAVPQPGQPPAATPDASSQKRAGEPAEKAPAQPPTTQPESPDTPTLKPPQAKPAGTAE